MSGDGRTFGSAATRPSGEGGGLRPYLFRVLVAERPLAASARYALHDIGEVEIGRGEADRVERAPGRLALAIADRWLSTRHASLRPVFGRWTVRDADSKNGSRVNGAPIREHALTDGDVLELGHTFFVFRLLGGPAAADLDSQDLRDPSLATLSPTLAAEYARVQQLAGSPLSILMLGESGAGKERVARAIHRYSSRTGRLVAVNCGALPAGLIESELFGHRRGAFSGAVSDHDGLIRAADRGTLFLDEVADLPAAAQVALLRVLEERTVRPVGGVEAHPVDLRVVAATHLDLPALVERGGFRRDLYARIAGYRFTLPALRARREDLGLIIADLLQRRIAGGAGLTFDARAARALMRHEWPLNVRELVNCLTTAAALAQSGPVQIEHLGEVLASAPPAAPAPPPATPSPVAAELAPADRALRDELAACLAAHGGNISAVARAMGKDRKQIQRWVKRFGLDGGR